MILNQKSWFDGLRNFLRYLGLRHMFLEFTDNGIKKSTN